VAVNYTAGSHTPTARLQAYHLLLNIHTCISYLPRYHKKRGVGRGRNRRKKEKYIDYYKKGTEKKEEVHCKSLTFQVIMLQCGGRRKTRRHRT
jgi:hypothetical protein